MAQARSAGSFGPGSLRFSRRRRQLFPSATVCHTAACLGASTRLQYGSPLSQSAPARQPVAKVRGLSKSFGEVQALAGLDLDVPHGVVGVLGPNGAGKSTLFRILLGLDVADGGVAELLGWPLPEAGLQARAEMGFMPEDDCLFPDYNGGEQVVHAAMLCGLGRVDAFARAHETLDLVGLADARYRKVTGYSFGMRQRLRLAMALVHGPRLLLLDEPTAGLDPEGRAEMLELVAEVGRAGTAILLSTHVLGDVDAICDHVVLLSRGRIGFVGPIERFRARSGRVAPPAPGELAAPSTSIRWLVETVGDGDALLAALTAQSVQATADGFELTVELPPDGLAPLWQAAAQCGVGIRRLEVQEEGMADAFVRHLRLDDPARREGGAGGRAT